jgi:hypothetical protein
MYFSVCGTVFWVLRFDVVPSRESAFAAQRETLRRRNTDEEVQRHQAGNEEAYRNGYRAVQKIQKAKTPNSAYCVSLHA